MGKSCRILVDFILKSWTLDLDIFTRIFMESYAFRIDICGLPRHSFYLVDYLPMCCIVLPLFYLPL